MRLHLVRHPRPDVAPGLCYGASDVAVDDMELERVAATLEAAGLPGALPVYASPLCRCLTLAERLRPARLHIDARLAEMDFGAWELRPWDAIPRADVDAWVADLLHYRPGGGENVLEVARRVAAVRQHLQDELRRNGEREAVVICHAGAIRLLSAMQGILPLEQAALRAAQAPHHIDYGEIVTLDLLKA